MGIISLGAIGRMVVEQLRRLDIQVIAHDPFVSEEQADQLGVKLLSLDELFERCDVVSLHTPLLKETEDMIRGRHFAAMRPHSTFINTARGAVVHEGEMIEVLLKRPDICAMLDVTWPEPPDASSPLWDMPNVFLTPHIAGSIGSECFRMGQYMLDELQRYLSHQPLKWCLTREKMSRMG